MGAPPTRKRIVFAAGAAVLVVAYAVLIGLRARSIEDYGQAAAALVAALSCLVAARRASGRARLGWGLLALSAAAWAAGETILGIDQVILGRTIEFPSAADAGFLTAIPLAALAVLALPFGPATAVGRLRVILDGLIVATSLTYVAYGLGLSDLIARSGESAVSDFLVVAYPAGDVVVLTLLALSLGRSPALRPVILVLMAAFAGFVIGDSTYAHTVLSGGSEVAGRLHDATRVAAFLAIGLAALWARSGEAVAGAEDTAEMWQLAIPWIAVFGVIAVSVYDAAAGRKTGPAGVWIGTGMGVIFLASQFLTFNDALRLLVRTRRVEAQLRERSSLLAEIIGRAPVGIARLSRDLRFIDANQSLTEMLCTPAQALVGSTIDQFLLEEDTDRPRRIELMLTHQADHFEVDGAMRSGDGRAIWVHRRVTPVFRPDGELDYYLVMFEDTTAKHEIEQAQKANVAELERINRIKSEFMSMVSHEFRTALTGIQGYSEMLTTEQVAPDDVRQFAGDINSEAQRLNRMITEMLDLDRIESGRIQLHPEPLDLNELVAGVAERARTTTSKHPIEVDADPRIVRIDGDADRLTQVLSNLVSNAIKYSPNGGKIMLVTALRDGDAEVMVKDHGSGIPPEFLKKIFGRYERYEGPGKTQVVGTGLGLAIAQQIIQLHGGRIWVDSKLGEGSEFHFTIPAGG